MNKRRVIYSAGLLGLYLLSFLFLRQNTILYVSKYDGEIGIPYDGEASISWLYAKTAFNNGVGVENRSISQGLVYGYYPLIISEMILMKREVIPLELN